MKTTLNNNREVSDKCVPYFIAEVNTSHFGDIEKAKKLIDAVKKAGADCVKFQSWSTDSLYSSDFYKENPIIFLRGLCLVSFPETIKNSEDLLGERIGLYNIDNPINSIEIRNKPTMRDIFSILEKFKF